MTRSQPPVRNGTPRHEQVPVKVNAWADRGVAPLVEALAEFPGLVSVESCQGGEGDSPDAYVSFCLGRDWRELGGFVAWLSSALGDIPRQPCPYRLTVAWNNGGSGAWAQLHVDPESVDAMAGVIRSVAQCCSGSTGPLSQ